MTMLRVWGGGVYPSDGFFDACDELGLLVWQDFMFACFDYPDPHGRLAAEVELEAAEQVRRLRHHASLALWCGENEVQGIHELTNGEAGPGDWGWSLFNELLPEVVAAHDPDTAYWPGSPWGQHPGELLNGTSDGDRHAWEVWHGGLNAGAGGPDAFASRGEAMHFTRYDHDCGRFISEFGIHASPELATLQRWTGDGLALGSPELAQRIKDTPKDKGWALIEFETGTPTTLQEYVDFSMACQAEGLKHGVEHYRRRQPHCNGTLVWQLNDSWPGLSWSVIDYDLVPKAAYYFLQRAYQPLLASFRVEGERLELWVSNSGREAVTVDLTVEIGPVTGAVSARHEVTAAAPAYSSAPVWTGALPAPDCVAWVVAADDRLPDNRRFFAPLRTLPLRESRLAATRTDVGNGAARVDISSRGYGYLVRVLCDRPGARFSTNYVDLRDGQSCTVEVTDIPSGGRLSVSSFGATPVDL
jgi:beta-mannosidase